MVQLGCGYNFLFIFHSCDLGSRRNYNAQEVAEVHDKFMKSVNSSSFVNKT